MQAIQSNKLTKCYKLYDAPSDRLKEFISVTRKKYHHKFYALSDLSFSVEKGRVTGIIGLNGSGKSTLLKIMSGVITPTSGNIQMQGRISSLLELGAGFNPEFTGRDNVYMNGALMGLSRSDIDRRFNDIESFADIGEFIGQPVKSYSSGMYVRLAFAVAINVDPDVLILDEVLAVGDIRFQKKCFAKLNEFISTEKTIIFVSHDMGSIVNLCHEVIWLDRGRIAKIGRPKEVVEDYLAATFKNIHECKGISQMKYGGASVVSKTTKLDLIDERYKSFGTFSATLTGIAFDVNENDRTGIVYGGDPVCLTMGCKAHATIDSPIIGFQVTDKIGSVVFGINSTMVDSTVHSMEPGNYIVKFSFIWPNLRVGQYFISPAIADGSRQDHIVHHWVHDVVVIQSASNIKFPGMIGISGTSFSLSQRQS